jgi:hypothetical protein
MDNWSEMRRNFGAYADFYTSIVKAIVGKMTFKKRLRTMAEGTSIATVSDKALALIGVENDSSDRRERFVRFAMTRLTHRGGKPISFHSTQGLPKAIPQSSETPKTNVGTKQE